MDEWLEADYEDRNGGDYEPLVDDPNYYEDDFVDDDEPMSDTEYGEWEIYRETVGIY